MLEKLLGFFGNDYRQVPPDECNELLHGSGMAIPNEQVQMAFVCGRDKVVFTTHRVMKFDTQGFSGQKVCYLSVPYTKIKSWEVESAGRWDMDAKVSLKLQAPWINGHLLSFKNPWAQAPWTNGLFNGFNVDFGRARCDVLLMQKFLAEQIIGNADGTSVITRDVPTPPEEGLLGKFASWLGSNYHQISAADATEQLRNDPAILLPDEKVEIAFKCVQDMVMFTTKRYLKIDVQAVFGKVKYESTPYKCLHCFYITSAAQNCFDTDAEVGMYTDVPKDMSWLAAMLPGMGAMQNPLGMLAGVAGMASDMMNPPDLVWGTGKEGNQGFDVKKNQGDLMCIYTLLNKKLVKKDFTPGAYTPSIVSPTPDQIAAAPAQQFQVPAAPQMQVAPTPQTQAVPMGTAVPNQMQVQAPADAVAGMTIQVQTPNGLVLQTQVPAGVPPGGIFTIQY
jgi:hypothetical protein